ncbi:hypothetical protein FISHEDRAFT_33151 [Fistulina hepatica ATCC 64428]|uniref:Elongator complex protein 5 n=1 Tax=Fistulina hepatica ATCC 64428 TaxID=1128425 RepID=A0A0D7APJ1_9AGAR|nr:hypothetical protein FISHEDRAFT_33151 [Fistulina hepatica ATCC 64428]
MISTLDLPQELFLLITDELSSPADFCLYQIIAQHLKKSESVIYLAVSEDITRLKSILSRSGVNVQEVLSSNLLDVVDASPPLDGHTADYLRSLYDLISMKMKNIVGPCALILDDIASMHWLGISTLDLKRFCRALRALCLKARATLAIRLHVTSREEPDDLFRRLLQLSAYHLEVRPLSSGKSASVSGIVSRPILFSCSRRNPVSQIALRAAPCAPALPPTKPSVIQYRLADYGAVFFDKGTGAAVL